MIYHFNDFTIVQLIHLMKGSEIALEKSNYNPKKKSLSLTFDNRVNLNEGVYQLEAFQVTSFLANNLEKLGSDILEKILIEKDPHQITFENENSSLKIELENIELKVTKLSNHNDSK